MANEINIRFQTIEDILREFTTASDPTATEVLLKGTGSSAVSVPFRVFYAYLAKTLKVSETGFLTYYDEDGVQRTIDLKMNWGSMSKQEQDIIIGAIREAAAEEIATIQQLIREVTEAEQERDTAETGREDAETLREQAEESRVTEFGTLKTASETATNAANTAAANANQKATEATNAATAANTAAANANQKATEADAAKTAALTAEGKALAAEQRANTAATNADAATTAANTAATNANNAATDARDTANHPTYFDADLYAHVWNPALGEYEKTEVNAGAIIRFDYIYSSVAQLEADTRNIPAGRLAIINTGNVEMDENARLYIRQDGRWQYLTDLSGIQGAAGKTPQLLNGTATAGTSISDMSVNLTPDGHDALGNPIYRLNVKLPCLSYDDLTAEQIADLQRPANDMIAQLQATDESVNAAETARAAAETARVTEFGRLKSESEAATAAANTAKDAALQARANADAATEAANTAASEANTAKTNALQAAADANTAKTNAEAATEAANTAAGAANTAKTNADAATEAANTAAGAANTATTNANTATANANQAKADADAATAAANSAATAANTAATTANTAAQNADASRTAIEANEATRQSNETARQQAKADLESLTDLVKNNPPRIVDSKWEVFDTATEEYVVTDVLATGRSPKIVDGIWYLYDDIEGDYVSSGVSVNSDFVLTKAKIEGVLIGDITTHTHDHLRYEAVVYNEAPDFATLASYTDALGGEQPFMTGNDIYVADDSEPTGYANYKLAKTATGNAWVRIPQIPAGYKIVLVKQNPTD